MSCCRKQSPKGFRSLEKRPPYVVRRKADTVRTRRSENISFINVILQGFKMDES